MSAADIRYGRQGGRRVPSGVDPTSLADDVARIVREHEHVCCAHYWQHLANGDERSCCLPGHAAWLLAQPPADEQLDLFGA